MKCGESMYCRTWRYTLILYHNLKAEGEQSNHIHQTNLPITMEPRKFILDKFQEHLEKSFAAYCIRHNLEQTHYHFVTYIIDQNLITLPYLQRFTVLREYEHLKGQEESPKTLLVNTLAHRFSISERTVWEILKKVKNDKSIKK